MKNIVKLFAILKRFCYNVVVSRILYLFCRFRVCIIERIKLKKIENLQNKIRYDLIKLGVRSNLLGFDYLCTAIELSILFPELKLCKGIYVKVSEKHNISYNSVERDIRFLIDDLNKGSVSNLNKFINKEIIWSKLTSGRFINILKDYYLERFVKRQNYKNNIDLNSDKVS